MGSTKIMRFGIRILLLGLGMISPLMPQVAGTPVSFLVGSLSSTTLRILTASGYALILLGLLVGLARSFRKAERSAPPRLGGSQATTHRAGNHPTMGQSGILVVCEHHAARTPCPRADTLGHSPKTVIAPTTGPTGVFQKSEMCLGSSDSDDVLMGRWE